MQNRNNLILKEGGYMDKNRLFDQYQSEPNPEHWRGFPEFMWDLGFEMDCYNSVPYFERLDRQTHTEKEIQDQLLSEMKSWTTQEIGNHIFSRYRELTHWSDYGYPEEKGAYFFERAFPILQTLLELDWNKRNTIPTLECFSEMVIGKFKSNIEDNVINKAEAFLKDEGRFHIQSKYSEYIEKAKESDFAIPKFYGVCVSETVSLLNDMF